MLGRENEGHVSALKPGLLLDGCYVLSVLNQSVEYSSAAVGVSHLTAAEHDCYLGLIPLGEEFLNVFQLELIVMLLGLRPKLHFLDDYHVLVFLGLLGPLGLLVLVFPIVHDPAHGWRSLGGHLYKVEFLLSGQLEAFFHRHDADLLSVGPARQPLGRDPENTDVFIWPYLAERPVDELSPPEQVDLYRIVPADVVDTIRQKKRWTWYRLVIGADGTWHAFMRHD